MNQRYARFMLTSSNVRRKEGIPYMCWSKTILNNTTGSMLGLPLSLQYSFSTNSYIFLKSMAASIFRSKCSCGTMFSKLTNSSCPQFSVFFTSIFLHPAPLYLFFPRNTRKYFLKNTFFDSLRPELFWPFFLSFSN